MPQQLIYTSAPRGLVAGRSGYCSVARSTAMREPLMLQLERFSYYQHLSLSGGRERPIFAYRIVDIRGSRFHVLSRIQDAGLDFTGRTNFIAHHLVFTPEEIRQHATPPVILRDWTGWAKSWTKEPQMLQDENWSELSALASGTNIPAQTWQRLTGDAVNGYGLLEARAGASFRVDDITDEDVLKLFAESLELLEVRDARRDFRASSWNYTFTTSMQEQDNPADFRWRCFHSDNPAANRFAGPDCRALSAVRATRVPTEEEKAFANKGRKPPRFIDEPQDVEITESKEVSFKAKAEGIPCPTYQWYKCDQNEKEIERLNGETSPEMVLREPPYGKTRYRVWASNSLNNAPSRIVTLQVNKLRVQTLPPQEQLRNRKGVSHIGREFESLDDQYTQNEYAQKTLQRNNILTILVTILVVVLIGATGLFAWKKFTPTRRLPTSTKQPQEQASNGNGSSSAQPPRASQNGLPTLPKPPGVPNLSQSFPLPNGWKKMPIGDVTNFTAEFIPTKSRFDLLTATDASFTNGANIFFVYETNTEKEFYFHATLQKMEPLADSSLAGIMLRESIETNSPFLFIGRASEGIVIYLSGSNQQLFESWPIAQENEGKSLTLAFKQINNQCVPFYGFGKSELQQCMPNPNFPIGGEQWLVGLALSAGNLSSNVEARFLNVSTNE